MSELAFNANGEAFDVPANVTAWRVRRMKPRGAPELVYGSDGRPLMVPIEATIDDLREAVGTAGKYRLDPLNDDGKCASRTFKAGFGLASRGGVCGRVVAGSASTLTR